MSLKQKLNYVVLNLFCKLQVLFERDGVYIHVNVNSSSTDKDAHIPGRVYLVKKVNHLQCTHILFCITMASNINLQMLFPCQFGDLVCIINSMYVVNRMFLRLFHSCACCVQN